MDLGKEILQINFNAYTYDISVSDSSQTWVGISQYTRVTLGTCSERDGGGL